MGRGILRFAIATSGVLALLLTGTIMLGTLLPRGDQLVFISQRDSHAEVYLLDVSRVLEAALTRTPVWVQHFDPTWSPDGEQIAFRSNLNRDYLKPQLFIMDADGQNVRQVTDGSLEPLNPNWSPDGQQIIFQAIPEDRWGLYLLDLNSEDVRRVTPDTQSARDPAWSPDGSQIALVSTAGEVNAIFVMESGCVGRAAGCESGSMQQLTFPDGLNDPDNNHAYPSWSPDGRHILYSLWNQDRQHGEVMLMAGDGSDQQALISRSGQNKQDVQAVMAPDGTRIAFVSNRDALPRNENLEIYVMQLGTGEIRRLTFHPSADHTPSWRPQP